MRTRTCCLHGGRHKKRNDKIINTRDIKLLQPNPALGMQTPAIVQITQRRYSVHHTHTHTAQVLHRPHENRSSVVTYLVSVTDSVHGTNQEAAAAACVPCWLASASDSGLPIPSPSMKSHRNHRSIDQSINQPTDRLTEAFPNQSNTSGHTAPLFPRMLRYSTSISPPALRSTIGLHGS